MLERKSAPSTTQHEQVLATLSAGAAGRGRRTFVVAAWLGIPVALVAGVIAWRLAVAGDAGPRYETIAVRRGVLKSTVTATGTLEALDQVEVGAELSGRVAAVYVDFNESVHKGQLLCELEADQWQAAHDQARAQLQVSQAELASAEATLKEAQATEKRTRALHDRGLESSQTLETAVAARARADAARRMTAAQVALARANLQAAETSLRKAQIVAPIDGVVLSRTVEPGQTVAAAFQAPVLFTLARDLTQMELEVDIDEADVGQVAPGQTATFKVDAYPSRSFTAELIAIRNLPTTTDNVVTYAGLLRVRNDALVLRPGMTATATIVTEEHDNALLVPNAAMRFSPPAALLAAREPRRMPLFGPPRRPQSRKLQGRQQEAVPGQATVWTLHAGKPEAVVFRGGRSDGQWTEVLDGDLAPGTEVLVDVMEAAP